MVNFTAKEISSIIRSCRDTGVKEFCCGELKLSFHDAASVNHTSAPNLIETGLPQEAQANIEQDIETDGDLRDIELQTLMINDPLAYEKAMRYEVERPGKIEQSVSRG